VLSAGFYYISITHSSNLHEILTALLSNYPPSGIEGILLAF
jgi:hypothetical protein